MTVDHIDLLVEEQSMEAFLREVLPRMLGPNVDVGIHPYQGKHDLLAKLPSRLRAYARWLPPTHRIVVLVDRDDDDCLALKHRMERIAADAGLGTKTAAGTTLWQVLNRVVIEELEAWYFGDWQAVMTAYPRASKSVPANSKYRNPDGIAGGTWEAFQRIMQRKGYFGGGLPKIEAARTIGSRIDPARNESPSFQCFRSALLACLDE